MKRFISRVLNVLKITLRFVWDVEKNSRYVNASFQTLTLRLRFVHHVTCKVVERVTCRPLVFLTGF